MDWLMLMYGSLDSKSSLHQHPSTGLLWWLLETKNWQVVTYWTLLVYVCTCMYM